MKYDWRWLGSKLKIEIDHDGVKWLFSEIIRSTKRIADMVFLDLSTNKMILFMWMWHPLVICIFYSLCWLGSSLAHLNKWHYLIGWKDHINSPLGEPNNLSYSPLAPISYPLLKSLINYIIFFTRNVDPVNKRIIYSTIFYYKLF